MGGTEVRTARLRCLPTVQPLLLIRPQHPAAHEQGIAAVARDFEPVKGQWYENVEEDELFRVLSVDEDGELVEIEYVDGDIEEMDLDSWHEMDLERTTEPEGWADDKDTDDDEDEDEEWDEDDEDEDDEDDDWDEDDEEEDDY
jgi:hypothetical protein